MYECVQVRLFEKPVKLPQIDYLDLDILGEEGNKS